MAARPRKLFPRPSRVPLPKPLSPLGLCTCCFLGLEMPSLLLTGPSVSSFCWEPKHPHVGGARVPVICGSPSRAAQVLPASSFFSAHPWLPFVRLPSASVCPGPRVRPAGAGLHAGLSVGGVSVSEGRGPGATVDPGPAVSGAGSPCTTITDRHEHLVVRRVRGKSRSQSFSFG